MYGVRQQTFDSEDRDDDVQLLRHHLFRNGGRTSLVKGLLFFETHFQSYVTSLSSKGEDTPKKKIDSAFRR